MREQHRVITFDQIAADLHLLRAEVGQPSYSDLVRRVASVREARGVPAEQARPARSTLYDAFREGRRRIDHQLVADLVRAMDQDEETARAWMDRCRRAAPAEQARADAPGAEAKPTQIGDESVPSDEQFGLLAEPAETDETDATGPAAPGAALPEPEIPHGAWPEVAPVPEPPTEGWHGAGRRRVFGVLALALAANLLGRALVNELQLSLYLDMVGTAIAAVVLGPWWAVGVGVTTNVAGMGLSGADSLPFALVQIVGALGWGYGVHRFGMGRTMSRFLGLNVLVALACTATAAPILLVYGGDVDHGSEDIVAGFLAHGQNLATAILSANMITSTADKLISGFIAIAALDALRRHFPAQHKRVAPATDLLHPRGWFVDARRRVGEVRLR